MRWFRLWCKTVEYRHKVCSRRSGIRQKIYTTNPKPKTPKVWFWCLEMIYYDGLSQIQVILDPRYHWTVFPAFTVVFCRENPGSEARKPWKNTQNQHFQMPNVTENIWHTPKKSIARLGTHMGWIKTEWFLFHNLHIMVLAGVEIGGIAKIITFWLFWSLSPNPGGQCDPTAGCQNKNHPVLDTYRSLFIDPYRNFLIASLFLVTFDDFLFFPIFVFGGVLPVNCTDVSTIQNSPRMPLNLDAQVGDRPKSIYFNTFDDIGQLHPYKQHKWSCINLLHWETPL